VDIEYASKELKGNYSFNSYLFLNTSAPLADLSKNKREKSNNIFIIRWQKIYNN